MYFTPMTIQISQKPLTLGTENEELQYLLPDFVPPSMVQAWIADSMEGIIVRPVRNLGVFFFVLT